MDRPSTPCEITAVVVGGAGAHGKNHLQHLIQAGVGNIFVVDPNISTAGEQRPSNVIAFRGTLSEFLQGENIPLHLVIDSSPDELHIPNMEEILRYGTRVLCSEKPVANNQAELLRYHEFLREAEHQNIDITTCLPRIMDAPYRELKQLLGTLMDEHGEIIHVKHTFGFQKNDTIASTGRDHLAHEISLVLFLLEGYTTGASVFYEKSGVDFVDSPTHYMARGRIGSVGFEVGGSRRAETSEGVELTLSGGTTGGTTKIILDARTGAIVIEKDSQEIDRKTVSPSNAINRLTSVSNRLVAMVLRTEQNYLTPHIQEAAIHGPATLFPAQ